MMQQKKRETGIGTLPAMAPLANPYVPFQADDPARYETGIGLVRGTIYPGLDLPFMGMANQTQLPQSTMAQLQELAFAVQELALYLDTHRDDTEALELYRRYQQMYREMATEYVKQQGLLNHYDPDDDSTYRWLSDPWPWEYCMNKEG